MPVAMAKESAVKKESAAKDTLTQDEKKTLLKIARDTIEKYVRERKETDLKGYALTPRLKSAGGAFVTITNTTQSSPMQPESLSGCIGIFFSESPLAETVREMAVAACSSDNRFPPVAERELKDIKVEISALSPLAPIADPLSIQKGVHGIYIKEKRGYGGGTYLPQVWTGHFPDKDAAYFWTHLCSYKAGLPADAWRHPDQYDILVYRAEVFGE
ncbi:MAG: AmmeMemoRadiSam system protein A [Candidatus Aureabacteria bacterium]|nr:AmmeMemoRadiSam system protein A [Candidatus Auribacterota bacterium]